MKTSPPLHAVLLAVVAACVPLACSDSTSAVDGYIEIPYPGEGGPTAPFCQWRRGRSGLGEPPPTGPEGTRAHREKARFPLPESGSCEEFDPEQVDRAIIRRAEEVCDAPIEGIARGCYRIVDADDTPECFFFAYYFSSCDPLQRDE